jgi:phosphatidylglycerol:prolipoprotein diacylglycerol transferase
MYPLVQIGPFRLSSGGLVLLLSIVLGGWMLSHVAQSRGGQKLAKQVDNCFYPVVIGAVLGARLWYGLFNLDLYSRNPALFIALRVSDFAWPGALVGGLLFGSLWCHWNGFDELKVADAAALKLPAVQMIASIGLLLSGEAFGVPTTLLWGVPLFGTVRHPTQVYFALAALLSLLVLWRLARSSPPIGALGAAYLGLNGLTLLLVEALRADSLILPGGLRVAQLFGLGLILYALHWARRNTTAGRPTPVEVASGSELQRQP